VGLPGQGVRQDWPGLSWDTVPAGGCASAARSMFRFSTASMRADMIQDTGRRTQSAANRSIHRGRKVW